MTDRFFQLLGDRLADLTKDLLFLHPPTGALVSPQVIGVMLDRPKTSTEGGAEYPYVRWLPYVGEFHCKAPTQFEVILDGGIYTSGNVADGNMDIHRLCMALGKIAENPGFAPYKLKDGVRFSIGIPDPEYRNPGIQPHPYYHCRLFLQFAGYHLD
ncbi:MAG: hypothetical protein LBD10_07475 [Desulfobulbus sp.]|jgi:hypothetical protein|uniref:hypothetical protein n=1 Tax=Desulfobulbus sp. TaxID=895 RepID=UPI00283E103D|nr:hypothetical protein [Desulfobulbus sp.]MDR2550018.1 hypothetical protein [Desulfobulbus sp.]